MWLCIATSGLCATYPAGSVVGFNADGGAYGVFHDGSLIESGELDDFPYSSFPAGVASTPAGDFIEAFWFDGKAESQSGLEIRRADRTSERLIFDNRQFFGLALGPNGQLWVSDEFASELIRIDIASGEIADVIQVTRSELLEDIDSAGYFYLLTVVPEPEYTHSDQNTGWPIRARY